MGYKRRKDDVEMAQEGKREATPEQARAVQTRGAPLLVSAAAGSGKTYVLVRRLLAYLTDRDNPASLPEFLVITYTKAAAGELSGRIRETLGQEIKNNPHDARLRRQLSLLPLAHISTLHAFCRQMIVEQVVTLGVRADARLLDQTDAQILRARVMDRVLEEAYASLTEGSPFAALVDAALDARGDRQLETMVGTLHEKMISHPFPARWISAQRKAFAAGCEDLEKSPWVQLLMAHARQMCLYGHALLEQLLGRVEEKQPLRAVYAAAVQADLEGIDALLQAWEGGWDRFLAALSSLSFARRGRKKEETDEAEIAFCDGMRDQWKRRVSQLRALVVGTLAEQSGYHKAVLPVVEGLCQTAWAFETALQEEKRRRNCLEFSDLEHLCVRLLIQEDASSTPYARQVSARFREILVDEYQDISPLQELILQALTTASCPLFMVGDVRQSIYRFRLADPSIFLRKYETYPERAAYGQPSKILLNHNFRSSPAILSAVNELFSAIMSPQAGEMAYTAREYLRPGQSHDTPGPPVTLLVTETASVPEETGEAGEDFSLPRLQREARAVAVEIRALLDKPALLANGQPVRPGDIALLFRSPAGKSGYFAQALMQTGIACAGAEEDDFFNAPEVWAAESFLAIVDNPRQDVPLLSVLRSPAYDFTLDRLTALRAEHRGEDLYDSLDRAAREGDAPAGRVMADLAHFRLLAGELPVDALLWDIYQRTGLLALYSAQENGAKKRENLWALSQLAQEFEERHARGLFAFLRLLDRMRADNMAPLRTAGGQGVSLLSIHRSKGLEYPVVFVCDCQKPFNLDDTRAPVLTHPRLGVGLRRREAARGIEYPTLSYRAISLALRQETLAEEMRVLYVAMTRARERLYLSIAADDWVEKATAYPQRVGQAVPSALIQEGRSFADWLTLFWGGSADSPHWRLAKGQPQAIPIPVQPAETELPPAAPQALSVEQINLIKQRVLFVYPQAQSVELPSKMTVTEHKRMVWAQERELPPPPYEFALPTEDDEITPAQRGTLTHRVMELIDIQKAGTLEEVSAQVWDMGKRGLLAGAQAAAIDARVIAQFFTSPLGQRLKAAYARKPEDVKREFAFSLLWDAYALTGQGQGEEILLQGMIDLCFQETGAWVVIDFKSDALRPGQEEARAQSYHPQARLYAQALARMTGQPVCEVWIVFLHTGQAVPVPLLAATPIG